MNFNNISEDATWIIIDSNGSIMLMDEEQDKEFKTTLL